MDSKLINTDIILKNMFVNIEVML